MTTTTPGSTTMTTESIAAEATATDLQRFRRIEERLDRLDSGLARLEARLAIRQAIPAPPRPVLDPTWLLVLISVASCWAVAVILVGRGIQ